MYTNLFDNRKAFILKTKIFIEEHKCTKDQLFAQIYNTRKFYRWFSWAPIVDIKFNCNHLKEGSIAKLTFLCPPFSYYIRCKKVIINESIEVEIGGSVCGYIKTDIIRTKKGYYLKHEISIRGKTLLIHIYYFFACAIPHYPYMKWRLEKMKEYLIVD